MPLTNQQLQQYRDDGLVIVSDFFPPDDLQPVIDWINELVDDLAKRLYDAGKIEDRHEDKGFENRLTHLDLAYPGAAVLIHIAGILGQPLADLWQNPRLLDCVEQVLGPEIAGHPVWNLRSKTPNNPLTTVPWHQDMAYLAEDAEHTFQPTVWLPLVPTTATNGTLQVVKGGHRLDRVLPHHLESGRGNQASWYLYIDDAVIDDLGLEVVTCEMDVGSFVMINNSIPHRSTENKSDVVRWSVDLRWQRPDDISGFEGIKDCIVMRRSDDPDFRIDWSAWAVQNRIADAMEAHSGDPFDTNVMGPWLERWASK